MEWITSTDFIAMLKRFPDTKIMARHYEEVGLSVMQTWEYKRESDSFVHWEGERLDRLTEGGFLSLHQNDLWRTEPLHLLTDDKQKALGIRIVEHLIQTGELDWIISDCNIEFVRQCFHCHRLMNEGWLCGDTYTYCSDECLLKENPGMTQEDLTTLYNDDASEVYWTEWED